MSGIRVHTTRLYYRNVEPATLQVQVTSCSQTVTPSLSIDNINDKPIDQKEHAFNKGIPRRVPNFSLTLGILLQFDAAMLAASIAC